MQFLGMSHGRNTVNALEIAVLPSAVSKNAWVNPGLACIRGTSSNRGMIQETESSAKNLDDLW